jgi:hypothetical protein
VARYLRSVRRRGDAGDTWHTFLANHREALVAFDFFTVPTVTFKLLYCFFEGHLRRLVREYVAYFQQDRIHDALGKDTPHRRPVEKKPCSEATVISSPRLGGLHHRCFWREAA